MTRRLIAATASAVLILGLAACDDGKGPVTTPPPDLGFEPQTSDGGGDESGGGDAGASDGGGDGETQAAPDIPAPDPADFPGMDEHSNEGAMQAARYFVATMLYAYQTGDSTLHDSISSPSCSSCSITTAEAEKLKKLGKFWSTSKTEDLLLETSSKNKEFDLVVFYEIEVREATVVDIETGETSVQHDSVASFDLGMDWINGRWIVSEYDLGAGRK